MAITLINLQSLVILQPDDILLISEFISNTAKFQLQIKLKELNFAIPSIDEYIIEPIEMFTDDREEVSKLKTEIQILKARNKRLIHMVSSSNKLNSNHTEINFQQLIEELDHKELIISQLQQLVK